MRAEELRYITKLARTHNKTNLFDARYHGGAGSDCCDGRQGYTATCCTEKREMIEKYLTQTYPQLKKHKRFLVNMREKLKEQE